MISDPLKFVDISPFYTSDPSEASIRQCIEKLASACREEGVFRIPNPVPAKVTSNAMAASKEFFAMPSNFKKEFSWRSPDMSRGYVSKYEEITAGQRDALESFDVYKPVTASERKESSSEILMGENQWPPRPLLLRKDLERYIFENNKLGKVLMYLLDLALKTQLGVDLDS